MSNAISRPYISYYYALEKVGKHTYSSPCIVMIGSSCPRAIWSRTRLLSHNCSFDLGRFDILYKNHCVIVENYGHVLMLTAKKF